MDICNNERYIMEDIQYNKIIILMVYPTTSISRNNIRKYLLENGFQIFPYIILGNTVSGIYRKYQVVS